MKLSEPRNGLSLRSRRFRPLAGFTLIEMVTVVAIGLILTAVAIPVFSTAMANMRINSAVSAFSGAISSARYHAIKDSQTYTFVLTTPANSFVLTNTSTGVAANAVPLPSYVSISGGSGSPYTYTLCPNGMVYGAGGCPGADPPALSFLYQGRQINLAVSEVGNVTKTVVN
ncbi:MAG: prepilin-type N-terminal cleavage/methylation domain-containing protein [Candidatus Acidiferrales bacterium]